MRCCGLARRVAFECVWLLCADQPMCDPDVQHGTPALYHGAEWVSGRTTVQTFLTHDAPCVSLLVQITDTSDITNKLQAPVLHVNDICLTCGWWQRGHDPSLSAHLSLLELVPVSNTAFLQHLQHTLHF